MRDTAFILMNARRMRKHDIDNLST